MSFHPTLPFQLPSLPPAVDLDQPELMRALVKARAELAELNGYVSALPNPLLLVSPAIIKESLASSEIENIHTTLIDVLQNELFAPSEQRAPDKEVLRYQEALFWGAKHLPKLSLSARLITGIQQRLIASSNGEFRKQQVIIGNQATNTTIYTPPMATEIPKLISNWELFANDPTDDVHQLMRAAIAHYQFEAIHPFYDGNGRTGRILLVLHLVEHGILTLPILFISGYLTKHRSEYYQRLLAISKDGAWEPLLTFMLTAFYEQAKATKQLLFAIMRLFEATKEKIRLEHRTLHSADLVEALFAQPVTTPSRLAERLGIHYTTASIHLKTLTKAGILKDKWFGRYHFFMNHALLKVMQGSS